jgi:hypothetical protein
MCDHVWIFEARTLSTQPVRDEAPQMWQAAYRHPTSTMRSVRPGAMPSFIGIAASSAKMRCKRDDQRFKNGHKTCQNEYRRFPHVFDYPGVNPGHPTGVAMSASQTLDSSGSKVAVGDDLPRKMFWRDKAGRGWYWELGEQRLFNRSGDLAARINELAAIDRRTGEPGDFRVDTELPAESGEKRRRAVPVKVRPFCASKQQKNAHFH